MTGVRYTVEREPGGTPSAPLKASEAIFLAIERTGAAPERVEWCVEQLSALIPRVSIDPADHDHVGVRITRVQGD